MKDWEFLIQQEGDYIWHPIQQKELEIVAGKYRLVAHSNRKNHEVEIRIFHQYLTGNCSHSENKTYFRRTNLDGLIMLLPFTYLQPGSWEIRCYGDIMAELLGDGWQATIRLQVLPETLKPILTENCAALLNLQKTQIILEQDSFYRNSKENITISGKIEAWELPFKGNLVYKLINPETQEVILILNQAFYTEALPLKFANVLDIPLEKESSFLLGELILTSEEGKLLARQPFTIETKLDTTTAEIASLINYRIELADTERDLAFAFEVEVPHKSPCCSLKVALSNPKQMGKTLQKTSPSPRQILPPKLTSPSTASTATPTAVKAKSLQLPLTPKHL